MQFTQYKTFSDYKSFDHGLMACKLLFEENHISNFYFEKSLYPVLYAAIYMHNKKDIDIEFIKNHLKQQHCTIALEELLKYIHLIRDADKLDILRIIIKKDFHIDNTRNGITHSIKKETEAFKSPTIKNSKTKLDTMAIQLSFLYNLHFQESRKFININIIFLKPIRQNILRF